MSFDFGSTRIFADGADRDAILSLRKDPLITGYTTNPTLMRAAGVEDYESFALDLVQLVPDRPISFEVFSDDIDEMYDQALKISSWGQHVYVKIPITNTQGRPTAAAATPARSRGRTAQRHGTAHARPGRGRRRRARGRTERVHLRLRRTDRRHRTDPVPIMAKAVDMLAPYPNLELIWASPREILNIVQAVDVGLPRDHRHARLCSRSSPGSGAITPRSRSTRCGCSTATHSSRGTRSRRRRTSGAAPGRPRSLHAVQLGLGLAHHELGDEVGGPRAVVEHAPDERGERHLDAVPLRPARAPRRWSSRPRRPCSSRSRRRRARGPRPISTPTWRLRLCGLAHVAMRSPMPASPANVSGSPPSATPRRASSASPRVISAALVLSP